MTFEAIKDSTSKKIYRLIREEIIDLNLAPGLSISEKEISQKFNVSRTPVREAFVRLAQEGLLKIYPRKGTFVSLIDLSSVEEACFMREYLEIAVVRLACEKFGKENFIRLEANLKLQEIYVKNKDNKKIFETDQEFHKLIFHGCHKKIIWATIMAMNSDFKRIRSLSLTNNDKCNEMYFQHVAIANAIKNKKSKLAENLMKEHLTMIDFNKKQLKKINSHYFTN